MWECIAAYSGNAQRRELGFLLIARRTLALSRSPPDEALR
jgi:hypothetical protein